MTRNSAFQVSADRRSFHERFNFFRFFAFDKNILRPVATASVRQSISSNVVMEQGIESKIIRELGESNLDDHALKV